jgi:Fe-S cluster biogenesis protein NfuA
MLSRDRVESVLQRIRPLLQADGGDIELVNVFGNSASVRLTGMCSGCPSAHLTLHMGVEMALREEIGDFEELQLVDA